MITIHNLEVRFEVEGEGDDAAFSKLFQQHMRRWQTLALERGRLEKKLADERAIVPDLYEARS